jgi:hypothetical protein
LFYPGQRDRNYVAKSGYWDTAEPWAVCWCNNVGDATIPYELTGADLWASCSKDTKSGELILKLVSRRSAPTSLDITLQGVKAVDQTATGWVLAGGIDDVNTVTEPTKVATKEFKLTLAEPKFTCELPPGSLTVIRVKLKCPTSPNEPVIQELFIGFVRAIAFQYYGSTAFVSPGRA